MDQEEKFTTQEVHEKIDRYLTGEMEGAERRAFEAEIGRHPALEREVERLRLAREAARAFADDRLRERMRERGEAMFRKTGADEPVRSFWPGSSTLRWAAAVLVTVVVLLGLKWYSDVNYDTSVLVEEYYQARKTPAFLSGDRNDVLQEGFDAYRSEDYDAAVAFFNRIPYGSGAYPTAQLYAGYAGFESGRYTEAIRHFENVMETGDSRYVENAEWHRVLALLATDDRKEQALPYLDHIRNDPSHSFHEPARDLHRKVTSVFNKIAEMGSN